MNRLSILLFVILSTLMLSNAKAQHTLQLDDGQGHYVTIVLPPGLTGGYTWLLPPNPPPANTAFSQGGSLEGQTLRWNNTLGYYVPTSALLIQSNGNMTLNPGAGNNITLTNIAADNNALLFLTIDGSSRVRTRTLSSILSVTANEGLVYDNPNIKLGGPDATTNPFVTNRFVNLDNHSLTFTDANGTTTLLGIDGVANQLTSGVNIVPNSNNLYTLGTASSRWKDLYLGPNSLFIGDGAGDQVKLGYDDVSLTAQKLTIDADDNGTVDASIDESGRLSVKDGIESNGNTDLKFRTNGVVRARFISETDDDTEGAFVPEVDRTYNLGTPTLRWKEIYVSHGSIKIGGFINGAKGSQNQQAIDEVTLSYADGALVIDKPVANFGSMVPNTNSILELGSSTNRWKDIWLGPNSIHIGAASYEGSISFDTLTSQLRFNSNNTIGTSEMILNGSGNLILSGLAAGGLLKANVGGQLAIATGGVDFESPLTFSNGLTRSSNAVALGGALTGATDIPLGVYNLTFSGTGGGRVGIGTTGAPAALLSVGAASPFQVNTLGAIAAATGITSSGAVTFSGLATGIVHSTAGLLSSSPIVSADLQDGTVADADLRNSVALSVIGRSANSVGVPADIIAGTDGHVLRRSGTTLGFGTIATTGIAAGANNTFLVTNNSTTVAWNGLSINGTNLSGNGIGTALNVVTGDLTSSTAALVVSTGTARLVGGGASLSLTTGDLTSTDITVGTGTGRLVGGGASLTIANNAVTFAKMQDITTARLIGRTTAASGDPEEISVNSTLTLSSLSLGMNLGNANTWAAMQTFSAGLTIPAGTSPMSVNGSNGTADQVLTSQGANSPEWKSISTLGVLTGTGASNKLAYWSGASTLTNDADLGYDGTTLSMAGTTDNISVGQSTSGGTNVRINMKDGHLRSQQTTIPTTAINANAGNAGSITLANATDVAGKITINTKGTGMAAGTQATITFNVTYNVAPIVVLTPANAKATLIQAYVTTTATTFSVSFNVAGGNNDDHEFYYHVIETQ
jgi:hypothetical protein